jgi:hypothetical protein
MSYDRLRNLEKPHAIDHLEVAPIVRSDKPRLGDQEVEITDGSALLPEFPTLAAEDVADLVVDRYPQSAR